MVRPKKRLPSERATEELHATSERLQARTEALEARTRALQDSSERLKAATARLREKHGRLEQEVEAPRRKSDLPPPRASETDVTEPEPKPR
jgi:predicted nuclease with TOPRIM domain